MTKSYATVNSNFGSHVIITHEQSQNEDAFEEIQQPCEYAEVWAIPRCQAYLDSASDSSFNVLCRSAYFS